MNQFCGTLCFIFTITVTKAPSSFSSYVSSSPLHISVIEQGQVS